MSRVEGVRQEQARLAIGGASRSAGVDFDYLLAQARIESGLNPDAKAKTSSAAGLYQFTTSTWLGMVDRHGDTYGAGWASAAISQAGGRHHVQDPGLRQQILALRYDPSLASAMAAEFAKENGAALRPILGREPDHAELYLAHFLGAGGAGKFIGALQSVPNQSAANLFPAPANANRSIFYAKDGSARSVSAVMDLIRRKVERAKQEPGGDVTIPPDPGSLRTATATASVAVAGFFPTPQLYEQQGPLAQEFARLSAPAFAQRDGDAGRRPMSSLLLDVFGQPGKGGRTGGAQVLNAYSKFQGFGL